jgi:hypothetical protein
MTYNVGTADRLVRIFAGLFLLTVPFWVEGDLRWLGLIGLIPLGTGLLQWCPLYSLFGIRSCPLRRAAAR